MDPSQMMPQAPPQGMGQAPGTQPPTDPNQPPVDPSQAQQQQADPIQALTTLILQYTVRDLNVDVQSKGILAVASAIKTLTEAMNPPQQTGVDPQILGQIEVQKAQHEMKLKEVELQHKMQMAQAELQVKAQMTQAKMQNEQQALQIKTAQAQQDAQIKQDEAHIRQATSVQNANMQAAQVEQKMAQDHQAHTKEMKAPSSAASAKAGGGK